MPLIQVAIMNNWNCTDDMDNDVKIIITVSVVMRTDTGQCSNLDYIRGFRRTGSAYRSSSIVQTPYYQAFCGKEFRAHQRREYC
jgi:hypothetical protein